jgi:hypothetical protein
MIPLDTPKGTVIFIVNKDGDIRREVVDSINEAGWVFFKDRVTRWISARADDLSAWKCFDSIDAALAQHDKIVCNREAALKRKINSWRRKDGGRNATSHKATHARAL